MILLSTKVQIFRFWDWRLLIWILVLTMNKKLNWQKPSAHTFRKSPRNEAWSNFRIIIKENIWTSMMKFWCTGEGLMVLCHFHAKEFCMICIFQNELNYCMTCSMLDHYDSTYLDISSPIDADASTIFQQTLNLFILSLNLYK